MKVGDLVRTSTGKTGLYLGLRTFMSKVPERQDYTCSEVYWVDLCKVSTIQTNLLVVINEAR
jgi:hypothetical protein